MRVLGRLMSNTHLPGASVFDDERGPRRFGHMPSRFLADFPAFLP